MNAMSSPKKVDLKSMDIAAQKRDALKRSLKKVLPEVFNEDKVDFVKLQSALGELVAEPNERFGLVWPGKNECMRIIQEPSVATLQPVRDESVDFDKTENLFIEGDNLEVLKLLQRSYFGKVKMIYIDPPYNTGKEFIYPDKYSETLDTYLEYTGQKDGNGRKFSTNTETSGRYHSRWLNMMYPRLYLAKNLLRDDGVIFISIDDNEQSNLKALCDQIFGEEHFLATLVWKKKYTGGKHAKGYVDLHEYVLTYCKSVDSLSTIVMDRPDDEKGKFVETDEFVEDRGKFYVRPLKSNLAFRRNLVYPVTAPDGSVLETQWLVAKKTLEKLFAENRAFFRKKRDGNYQLYKKYYEHDGEGAVKVPSLIEKYPNSEAKAELKNLFDVKEGRDNVFYTVKPKNLIKFLLQPHDSEDALVLDFFAGAGTTAEALYEMNLAGGNRKFIVVQLPERIKEPSEFATVAEIGKERIRRAAKKIADEKSQSDLGDNGELDLGFKVFKLARSNFKVWEGDSEKITDLGQQLKEHIDHIAADTDPEAILYELLLKTGCSLTAPVEKLTLAGKEVFAIDDGDLLICLEKEISQEVIDAIANKNPSRVICLDESFGNNDQLKTNAVHTFKIRAEHEGTEIVFRTV